MNKIQITKMIMHTDVVKETIYTIGRREEYVGKLRTLIVLDSLAWKLSRVVTYIKEEGSRAKLVNGIYYNIPVVVAKGEVYETILETINDLKDQYNIDIEEELKDTMILLEPMKLSSEIKDLGFDDVSSMYPGVGTIMKQLNDKSETSD